LKTAARIGPEPARLEAPLDLVEERAGERLVDDGERIPSDQRAEQEGAQPIEGARGQHLVGCVERPPERRDGCGPGGLEPAPAVRQALEALPAGVAESDVVGQDRRHPLEDRPEEHDQDRERDQERRHEPALDAARRGEEPQSDRHRQEPVGDAAHGPRVGRASDGRDAVPPQWGQTSSGAW
jgi:hypothetical protein